MKGQGKDHGWSATGSERQVCKSRCGSFLGRKGSGEVGLVPRKLRMRDQRVGSVLLGVVIEWWEVSGW